MKNNFSKGTMIMLTGSCLVLLFAYIPHNTFGAFIQCPATTRCYGTPESDIIISNNIPGIIIHGGAGNDYITGSEDERIGLKGRVNEAVIYGDDGDDTIIGGPSNDYLNGGRGNDKYFGGEGDDTLVEMHAIKSGDAYLFTGNDYIAGGDGDDYIDGGFGADRIFGGGDNTRAGHGSTGDTNYIIAGPFYHPDFSVDIIDCGPDHYDIVYAMYHSDGDVQSNCESVM
jgi:RTX calcium-binding nonapeptide repeat (4 copies)